MSDNLITAGVGVLVAIVGVGALAAIVSKNSNTPAVLTSFGNALAKDIGAAVSPLAGQGSVTSTLAPAQFTQAPGGSAFL